MKAQIILDNFEDVSTTIHVVETGNGDYYTFNEFGVVPVKCDIEFFLEDGMQVEDTFFVDCVTLDTSDDCITFELNDTTQQMLYSEDIISFNVSKISKTQYREAIREDKHRFDGLF